MNPYQYIVSFAKGVGGIIRDASLILRPNFNDMANLSLTSPSNGSAVFNGSSDYISAATLNNYSGFTALSVSAWVYVSDFVAPRSQVSSWGPIGSSDYAWLLFSGQFIDYQFSFLISGNGSSYARVDNGTNLTQNRWYYVTAIWEAGTSMKIYIDGSLNATNTSSIPSAIHNNGYQTLIGADGDVSGIGRFHQGNLANVAVWNRALTSDEINSIMWKRYDLLTAGESTGLVAWYALDDITGTSVPDSTGTYNATAY